LTAPSDPPVAFDPESETSVATFANASPFKIRARIATAFSFAASSVPAFEHLLAVLRRRRDEHENLARTRPSGGFMNSVGMRLVSTAGASSSVSDMPRMTSDSTACTSHWRSELLAQIPRA
jgi:hypothetical protein